jgi:hypothetical protein
MRLFSDKIATVTALIGVLLMVATILTRVNPAEGSVIRPEFLKTPLGQPITLFLLITSIPGWIGIMLSMPLAPMIKPKIAVWISSLLFQFAAYWVLGKAISLARRKWTSVR